MVDNRETPPQYFLDGLEDEGRMAQRIAEHAGCPPSVALDVMRSFFAIEYKTMEPKPDHETGRLEILDQWGQGVTVYPDLGWHYTGG